jgi:hypothetical protein
MRPAFSPALLLLVTLAPATAQAQLAFTEETIATELGGGYQVVATDLNRDGRPDLIALASRVSELVWFENPGWERRVIVDGRAGMINLAAYDIDADGVPEIALAEGFSTRPERSEGIVSILSHAGDPTAGWSVEEIDRVPTAHRLRWIDVGGQMQLLNAPLVGATAEPPEYRGETPIYVYYPNGWHRARIANDGGVIHAVTPVAWYGPGSAGAFLSASFLGVHLHEYADRRWLRTRIHRGDPAEWPGSGSSEADLGWLNGERFIATIDPWHGNQVTVYQEQGDAWTRQVIDDTLEDGHTLVVADLDGDGNDEIVAGARRGAQVALYRFSGEDWAKQIVDDGGMAAAGCAVADLDGDGRADIACIGSGTANLKWYRNTP